MKNILIIFLLFISTNIKADIIFLNNGEEINSKISKIENNKVYTNINNEEKSYDLKDILKIQLIKEYSIENTNPLELPEIKEILSNPLKKENNANYLTYLYEITININEDKSYKETIKKINYVFTEKGKDIAGNSKNYYFPYFQKPEIDFAFNVLNNKVNYLNDVSVQTGNEFSSYPEYDILKSQKFSVPNIKINSIVDYQYSLNSQNNPLMPFYSNYILRIFEPIKKIIIKINVPKNLTLNFKDENFTKNFSYKTISNDKTNTYVFEGENIPTYLDEDQMPPLSLIAPQIFFSLNDSWENITNTFKKEIESKINISQKIKDSVKDLIKDKKTNFEKMEAIFNWVNASISLDPITMPLYSFVPKDSDKIFNIKIGNYLDKPFLLYIMLKEANLNPSFSYATNKTDLFQKDLPNISQFNYAQVNVNIDGKNILLFPTSDKQRYNQIPYFLQGSYALQILGENSGQIFKNSELSAKEESVYKEEELKMDENGNLMAELTIKPYGNNQVYYRDFKDYKEKEIKNYFEKYVHSINPNARLLNYNLENLNDMTKDLIIKVSYKVNNYALNLSNKYLLFKFPLIKFYSPATATENRTLPIYYEYKDASYRISKLLLPKGYFPYYYPQRTLLNFMTNQYDAQYIQEGNYFILKENIINDETLINPEKYLEYKDFNQKIALFTDTWLVLKKE